MVPLTVDGLGSSSACDFGRIQLLPVSDIASNETIEAGLGIRLGWETLLSRSAGLCTAGYVAKLARRVLIVRKEGPGVGS